MKKLLLILICLFVSSEVKSESDDLTGSKLLCRVDDKNKELIGYEFIPRPDKNTNNYEEMIDKYLSYKNNNSKQYEVNFAKNLVFRYQINLLDESAFFIKDILNYRTTLFEIEIGNVYMYELGGKYRFKYLDIYEYINRETLQTDFGGKCQLVDELNNFFIETLNKKIKNIRSKHKI